MIEKYYRTDDFFFKKASNHSFRCSLSKEIPKIHFIIHAHMEKFWQFTENMIKKNNLQNAKLPMKFF